MKAKMLANVLRMIPKDEPVTYGKLATLFEELGKTEEVRYFSYKIHTYSRDNMTGRIRRLVSTYESFVVVEDVKLNIDEIKNKLRESLKLVSQYQEIELKPIIVIQ